MQRGQLGIGEHKLGLLAAVQVDGALGVVHDIAGALQFRHDVGGIGGELAVLAGHIPFVTALADGDSRVYLPDGTIKQGHADGGMLMVSNECVRVMALRFSWKE